MGKTAKVENSVICETLQKQNSKDLYALEEDFDNLQITAKTNETDELESKLKDLNIEENNQRKLIERGPITTTHTEPSRYAPYTQVKEIRNVQEFVSSTLSSGGTLYSNDSWHQWFNNTNVNISHVYENQASSHQNTCTECGDQCTLPELSPKEITEILGSLQGEQIQISDNPYIINTHYENNLTPPENTIQFELNISQPESTINELDFNIDYISQISQDIFCKPQIRRISYDSGIGSPSSLSDLPLSPGSSNTVIAPMPPPPPPKPETKCRIIRPKHAQMRKTTALSNEEKEMTNTENRNSKDTSKTEVQKEILSATLNSEVRKEKWSLYISKGNTIFEIKNDGKTILHELLFSKEKYIEESFYSVVERMKKNPTKCVPIIEAQSSIKQAIKDNHHNQILADYFDESVAIIQQQNANK